MDEMVRIATEADAADIGRLVHDFNVEFDEPTPDAETLAGRFERLLREGEVTVLLTGDRPEGLAVLRLRPSYYADAREAYLQELYVVPERRGNGLGRALLEAAIETARNAGAVHLDLNTAESDTAARALYERMGFTSYEGGAGGPLMIYYEREL